MTPESRSEHSHPIVEKTVDRIKKVWGTIARIKHEHLMRRGQINVEDFGKEIVEPYDELVALTAREVLAARTREDRKETFATARKGIPYGTPIDPLKFTEDVALLMAEKLAERVSLLRKLSRRRIIHRR